MKYFVCTYKERTGEIKVVDGPFDFFGAEQKCGELAIKNKSRVYWVTDEVSADSYDSKKVDSLKGIT